MLLPPAPSTGTACSGGSTLAPTRHELSRCDVCEQPVLWTITEAGRPFAVDPKPNLDGNTVAIRDGLGVWRSRRPPADRPKALFEQVFYPHVASCTKGVPVVLPDNVTRLDDARRRRRGLPPRPRW
ncbi:hypothetical protein ABZ815_20430 [Nonomuraea sp. NPDC047529]|uniref:hypothetical protein n=1 Tax=Nonomuraea sp. NPDC047529 TaxID=3155623 RepID=UPI0033EEE0DB